MDASALTKTSTQSGFGLPASVASEKMLGPDDFFKLLSAQLANQDPMKPMDDLDFIGQMSNFTSLEQMRALTKSFDAFSAEQAALASHNYLGKEVALKSEDGSITSGVVSSVQRTVDEEGNPLTLVAVGEKFYNAADIVEIRLPSGS